MRLEEIRRVAISVTLAVIALWSLLSLQQTEALLAPISVITAEWTSASAAWLGLDVAREVTVLRHADGFVCEVGLTCTALVPLLLLATVMFASAATAGRRIVGIAIASVLLCVVNQIRLTNLVWLGVHQDLRFDVMHTTVWPMALAAVCIAYWLAWKRVCSRS